LIHEIGEQKAQRLLQRRKACFYERQHPAMPPKNVPIIIRVDGVTPWVVLSIKKIWRASALDVRLKNRRALMRALNCKTEEVPLDLSRLLC
jgi:hypothetical protein